MGGFASSIWMCPSTRWKVLLVFVESILPMNLRSGSRDSGHTGKLESQTFPSRGSCQCAKAPLRPEPLTNSLPWGRGPMNIRNRASSCWGFSLLHCYWAMNFSPNSRNSRTDWGGSLCYQTRAGPVKLLRKVWQRRYCSFSSTPRRSSCYRVRSDPPCHLRIVTP